MANENAYFSTSYSFVSPIRHFKANDPYYYEIDNVPIKQLEESTNFLKDQVDGLIATKDSKNDEIDRSGFSELKPYATEEDRVVRVKPGRYTARINDAYDITPLQNITKVLGRDLSDGDNGFEFSTFEYESNLGPTVSAALSQFSVGIAGTPYMMNGLFERAFVYPIGARWGADNPTAVGGGFAYLNVSDVGYDFGNYTAFNLNMNAPYPNYDGVIPTNSTTAALSTEIRNQVHGLLAKNQGRVESNFIKRWRGAIRTSVIDVPDELTIDIPEWDPQDFYFIDENGTKQTLGSTQRIDLLFIYSKAVDQESTTIPKFDSGGNPTTLTKATLGILKGAGVGVSLATGTATPELGSASDDVRIQSLDGVPLMMSHPGDYDNGLPVGFQTSAGVIRGSFPSPDDLMNLAPVLSDQLESTAFPLIGQSILPIAYIKVEGDGAGPITDLVLNRNIIDIRPFFRTTELAYNERAGIAAATPQISIANPVVSETQLEQSLKTVYDNIEAQIAAINVGGGGGGPGPERSRVVGCGQILGGFNYGPEGAIAKQLKASLNGVSVNNTNFASLFTSIESELGLGAGAITNNPYWDKADWWKTGDFQGTLPNDYINVADQYFVNHGIGRAGTLIGGDAGQSFNGRQSDNVNKGWRGSARSNRRGQMFYVSKRINLDKPGWMADYHVDVELLNCVYMNGPNFAAMGEGIWVDKFEDYFIINVAWNGPSWRRLETVEAKSIEKQANGFPSPGFQNSQRWWTTKMPVGGADAGNFNTGSPEGTDLKPWANRNDTRFFTGFGIPQINLKDSGVFKKYVPSKQGPDTFNGGLNYGYSEGDTIASNGSSATSRPFTKPEYFSGEVIPILYPSVSFKITGFDADHTFRARGNNGRRLSAADPTINLL
jgi:hypothetical protein